MIVLAAIGFMTMPYDQDLLARLHFLHGDQDEAARQISRMFSIGGDYPQYNVTLALVIWIYGVRKRSRAWRRIAVICFLGATLAGLFSDCFRMTMGRPRPDANLPDHFYGITNVMHGTFQSFPSGHAATAFGTAAALLVVDFPLGLATTVFALAVVWARLELYRHYPSDVVVGAGIGLYFGLMVGFGASVRRTRK